MENSYKSRRKRRGMDCTTTNRLIMHRQTWKQFPTQNAHHPLTPFYCFTEGPEGL